jgi:hypothetical protein
MSGAEHIGVFISIILGLAVADLCVSFNRLLEAGSRVRWDWLAPMAALVALLKILVQWFEWFPLARLAPTQITFEVFLLVVAGSVLMFLVAAAALPDRADEAVVDLRGYYAHAARRYWLLYAAQYLMPRALVIWLVMQVYHRPVAWSDEIRSLVTVAIALLLAFARNRWLHTLCLAGFLVVLCTELAGHAIG